MKRNMRRNNKPIDELDAPETKLLTDVENAHFLRLLRRYHPSGPLSYAISSDGVPKTYSMYAAHRSGGSPAGMCADTI